MGLIDGAFCPQVKFGQVGGDLGEDAAADVALPRCLAFAARAIQAGDVGRVKADEHGRPLTFEGFGSFHAWMISEDIRNGKSF